MNLLTLWITNTVAGAATIELDTNIPVPRLARYIEGRIGVQAFVENAPFGHHTFVTMLNIHGEPTRHKVPLKRHYTFETHATNATEAAAELQAFQTTWQASDAWDGCTTYGIEVYEEILEVTPTQAVNSEGACAPYTSRLDVVMPEIERRERLWIKDLNLRIPKPAPGARSLRDTLRATLIAKRDQSYVLVNIARADGRSSQRVKAETLGTAVGGEDPADYPFHPKHREPPADQLFENQPDVQAHRAWIAKGERLEEHPGLQDVPEDLREQVLESARQQSTTESTPASPK